MIKNKIKKFTLYITLLSSFFITRLIPYDSHKSLPAQKQQNISKAVDEVMKKYNIPGAIVGVWTRNEGLWIKAFGKSDLVSGKEIKWNDKVRIGSITKTFVATVVLQLAEDKKVRLDEPLAKYVPRVPGANKITIRQLLNHTSGIFDYTEDEKFWPRVFSDPLKLWSAQELVDIAIAHPPKFSPGQGFSYSNTNYILLGIIIEMVTASTVEDEVRRRVLEPLEFKQTTFEVAPYILGEYSHGYIDKDGKGNLSDITLLDPSLSWASGAMVSNIQDLAIWARILSNGSLLSERAKNEQFKFIDTGQPHSKYGLGVARLGNFIGHDGGIPGYNSAMFYLPARDTIIIVLLNNFSDANIASLLFMKIAKIVVPGDAPW
jgi:D-alanyl-D-alanine carboxypeptidase